jgi:hypothetical protein
VLHRPVEPAPFCRNVSGRAGVYLVMQIFFRWITTPAVVSIKTPQIKMKAMRLRWAISMLILAGAVGTASAQTAAPFTLRISGPGTVALGQPARVRVLLQNTSDHAIGVIGPNAILAMDGSELSIQGPSGLELPRTEGMWDHWARQSVG